MGNEHHQCVYFRSIPRKHNMKYPNRFKKEMSNLMHNQVSLSKQRNSCMIKRILDTNRAYT